MSKESTYNSGSIITGSERDGWVLGYVGLPWPGPWPKKSGDLFVADPQGWQAGIAWESNGPEIQKTDGPSEGRWGVFQVRFPMPVMSEQDLIQNFHLVLPLLKEQRLKVTRGRAR
jgi:hypothetical protein